MGWHKIEHCRICCNVSKWPTTESKHQKMGGLIQEIKVPSLKWEDVNMDFVVVLPQTRMKYDYIWVVIHRLMKYTNFIFVKSTY